MERIRLEWKKHLKLFRKRIFRYFIILVCIVILTVPLIFTSYNLMREKIINNSYDTLKKGLVNFETQIMNLQRISHILISDKDFSQLLLLKGFPQNEDYVCINAVQNKLRKLCLDQELISNVHLVFRNNPVYISNYISTDDYNKVYPLFFNYVDQTVDEWYKEIFMEKFKIKFLPQSSIYSKYYNDNYFEAITCILNNSTYGNIDFASAIACTVNLKSLLNSLLDRDISKHGFIYIRDIEGNIIFKHNYDLDQQLENVPNFGEIKIGGNKHLILKSESLNLGLSAVAGIPASVFRENIKSIISIVILYSIIGIMIILIISLYFSIKETISVKKLIEIAFNASNIAFNVRDNEYSYIDTAIKQIRSVNTQQSEHIDVLKNSIRALIFENLFSLGVFTDKDEEEIIEYFDHNFKKFCVVKVRFIADIEKSYENYLFSEIDDILKNTADAQYISLNFRDKENILVFFFDEIGNTDAELIRRKLRIILNKTIVSMLNKIALCPPITMGVSMVVQGVRKAKDAYIQANYAVDLDDTHKESGIILYETPKSQSNWKFFDIAELLKIYNSVLSGDTELMLKVFDHICSLIDKNNPSEQEQLQILFTLRQTLYTAYMDTINNLTDFKQEEIPIPAFPDYLPDKDFKRQLNILLGFSKNLCSVIEKNRRSQNKKLRKEILDYINLNYHNAGLNAANIAEEMLISEKYVFSFMKEQTGKSLGQYVEDIRVLKAEELLLRTDYTNKSISQICGFGSENTFYRAFLKKHGLSPRLWKENKNR